MRALTLFLLACAGGSSTEKPAATGPLTLTPADGGSDAGDDDDDDDGGGGGGGSEDGDRDGDGLSDDEEAALGLDPDDADSDGDGWEDGDEVGGNTDASDPSDFPYQGGWPIDACRDDLVASGHRPGQVAEDFRLQDQFGETVRLHDFCDQVVLLVASAMWCGPCNYEAPELGRWYDQWADDGFLVITLLAEDPYGSPTDTADLRAWADAYGLSHPVLADTGFGVSARYVLGSSIYLPSTSLLGAGAEVLIADGPVNESQIQAALDAR